MNETLTIALAGNPNSGKTTVFNNLTGARQHVGNYPGVTVEYKEGTARVDGKTVNIVDLPGTYSLTAYSAEELVARNYIIDELPDVVIDVIDASNLERNLYLAVQLMELNVPLVLAFNMSDAARSQGYEFDLDQLSSFFGAPIVETVGHRGKGMDKLLQTAIAVAGSDAPRMGKTIHYGREMDRALGIVEEALSKRIPADGRVSARWIALKLMENDSEIMEQYADAEIRALVQRLGNRIQRVVGEHPETVIAGRRYGYISGACTEAVRSTVELRHSMSDMIDAVVVNRVLGIPIFLGLMYFVFWLTFTVGDPLMGLIESGFGILAQAIESWWPPGAQSPLKSLIIDGIIGGTGGVIIFLPNILLLFLAIAVLEDSGYMARAAFIMDRLMHKIGLHGKSFIPMLIGFGCSVPAIMATRTLDNRRDRLVTMLIVPLMSCGARLPIYALIIPAFFPKIWHAPMLWIIYLIGILLAILSAKLLRSTVLRGESVPFVMELPPYRIPTLKGVFLHMWERGWMYLKKAGTVILGISIVLWFLTSYPKIDSDQAGFEQQQERLQRELLTVTDSLDRALFSGTNPLSRRVIEQFNLSLPAYQLLQRDSIDTAESQRQLHRLDHLMEEIVRLDPKMTQVRPEPAAASDVLQPVENLRISQLRSLQEQDPVLFAAAMDYLHAVQSFRKESVEIARARKAWEMSHTVAGRIGRGIEPVLKPLGFDWRIGTALIGALAAKEVFVAQMGIVFSVGSGADGSDILRQRLRDAYSPLAAFAIMLFVLISAPCMATIAVTRRESNSWGWAMFQLGGLTVLAWIVTFIAYQGGLVLGLG